MKKSLKIAFVAASTSLMLSAASSAALSLVVDTVNETLSFTGSDSVTPADFSGRGYVQWQLNDIPTAATGSGGIDQATGITMFTSSNSTPVDFASANTINVTDAGANRLVGIWMAFDSTNATTVTGNGLEISYAGWEAGAKTILETGIGSSMAGNAAFGNDAMAVVAPVPEPSSTALLGLGSLALLMRRRR